MYKTIKTSISSDRQKHYSIYKHRIEIDGISTDTYGISVSDQFKRSSVDDAATDIDIAVKLLNESANASVSADNLKDFVIDFLSEL